MKETVKFLTDNPVQYLATVGCDGKPKCRPFMFCFEKEGKLWFCTSNNKEVYKEMQKNPAIELSITSSDYAWIRLSGRVVFENSMTIKAACLENPIVKANYNTADNPLLEVFHLADAQATIADFSGNPPKTYSL